MVVFQAITVLIIAFFVIMLCFGESISTKLKEDLELSSIAEKIEDVRKMSMESTTRLLDNRACVSFNSLR